MYELILYCFPFHVDVGNKSGSKYHSFTFNFMILTVFWANNDTYKLNYRFQIKHSIIYMYHYYSQNFNMCIQNKTVKIQWNQNLTRTWGYLGLHKERKWVKTIKFSSQEKKAMGLISPSAKHNLTYWLCLRRACRPCCCDQFIMTTVIYLYQLSSMCEQSQ